MTEPEGQLTPENLDPSDKETYEQVKYGFESDPDSIPEKFQNAENPALALIESYRKLEQQFHASRQGQSQEPEKTQETPETPAPEEPETPEEKPDALPAFESDSADSDTAEIDGIRGAKDLIASNRGEVPENVREYLKTKHSFTDEDIDSVLVPTVQMELKQDAEQVLEMVGGQDNFQKLYKWVKSNKSDDQVAAINEAALDPVLREPLIRGLMAEAGLNKKPTTEVNPMHKGTENPVQPYASQTELNQDLLSDEIKNHFHPNHQKKQLEIQKRMAATPPGILS